MQEKSKFILLILVLIIIVALFASNPTIFTLGTNYGTGVTVNTTSTRKSYAAEGSIMPGTVYLTVDNKLNYLQPGELLTSDRYIVSWQPGQYSVPITAKCDITFSSRMDFLWCYLKSLPTALLQDYYWDVTYTDLSGNSVKIIDGKNFVGGASDTSVKLDYVKLISGLPRDYFPNLADSSWAMTGTGGSSKWYSWSSTYTGTLQTTALQFEMKGCRVGTLNVKCYLTNAAWANWDEYPIPCQRTFSDTGPILLSEDNAYLPSGRGEVRILSTNAVRTNGSEKTDTTGITYTRYVYEEGSTVTFSVDTGFSGSSLDKNQEGYETTAWYMGIYNNKGVEIKSIPLQDNLKGYIVYFMIPTGSFTCGNNEWHVTLRNTLFDQSETRFFVVDTLTKIPGKTTAVADKNEYDQWENAKITLSATANSQGSNEIKSFHVWATYDSPSSTNYAMQERQITATLSGGKYIATVDFQVVQGDKYVYFSALAMDKCGRAGPEGELQLYVKQVIPGSWDLLSDNYTILIIALVGISAAGIGSYLYLKRRKKK